jgi:hypothetical protein
MVTFERLDAAGTEIDRLTDAGQYAAAGAAARALLAELRRDWRTYGGRNETQRSYIRGFMRRQARAARKAAE